MSEAMETSDNRIEMKQPSNQFFALTMILFLSNCSFTKQKLKCFEREQKEIRSEQIYNQLRLSFQDTLKSWISRGLQPKMNLETQMYKLDDALICDSQRNKCLMFILLENKLGTIRYSTKFIGCERNPDNSWAFYYRSYPVTYYSYLTHADNPFEYMSKETYLSLIIDGLIDDTCNINDEYLTSEVWFGNNRRNAHENFLRDTL